MAKSKLLDLPDDESVEQFSRNVEFGWFNLATRLYAFVWFTYACFTTQKLDTFKRRRCFYIALYSFYSAWILSGPFIVLLTLSMQTYYRARSLPPSCRAGGFPVHHDPMHGIVTNPKNREWVRYPLSFFVVCDNPIHRVLVNWDPPISQVIHLPGGIQT